MSSELYSMGLVGCGVMGRNLALNMERNGFSVAVYDKNAESVEKFLAGDAAGKKITGSTSLDDMVGKLEKPRRILMMVPAGDAVDASIDTLMPRLEKEDILIDGGNSNFKDTMARSTKVEAQGFQYIGAGVSGGEEGALWGPSIMPGCTAVAWERIKPVFQAICAKTDDGTPCCERVGTDGAGHFVKMVHNGIEYSDMQMICETYDLMKRGLGLSNQEMHGIFKEWNQGELDSYLIEITRDILAYQDSNGEATIDIILDTAGQKGTGKWTAINALDLGQPLTSIGESVFARFLSALKEERVAASKKLSGPEPKFSGDKAAFIQDLRKALYASKIMSYAQGYQLMRAASEVYDWTLNFGGVALIWRGGCIIRSVFLGHIKEAFDRDPGLVNLVLDPFFAKAVQDAQDGWRRVIAESVKLGIPAPAMASALSYYDAYRSERLPANLLQAQRDYFGAHTYERVDKPRGEFFHTQWQGEK